jgi:D-aminopeptidase
VDEEYIHEHVAVSRAQVAVKMLACLWAIGCAGCKPEVPSSAAGGDAQAASEILQHLRNFITAALHETTAATVAKSICDVVALNRVTAITLTPVTREGERAHPNADPAGILERLVVLAEGGVVLDCTEPNAPGPIGDVVK